MPTSPQYYQKNKARLNARRLERIRENPEENRRRCREYYAKNKERILGYKKKYRDLNREEIRAKARLRRASATERDHDYLRRDYGLTIEQYNQMFSAQGGVCAICKKPDPKRRLAVDHCHDTGRVRELLCIKCNSAIGKLYDDPKMLDRAAAYLRKHGKD
jgi:hypothetical protein